MWTKIGISNITVYGKIRIYVEYHISNACMKNYFNTDYVAEITKFGKDFIWVFTLYPGKPKSEFLFDNVG